MDGRNYQKRKKTDQNNKDNIVKATENEEENKINDKIIDNFMALEKNNVFVQRVKI
jgi:hypothetical protein